MVVYDKQDYINTAKDLLVQRDTYRILTADPTNKHKNEFLSMLRTIKVEGLEDTTYKRLYPNHASLPKFNWQPKIHKQDTPLGPQCPAGCSYI